MHWKRSYPFVLSLALLCAASPALAQKKPPVKPPTKPPAKTPAGGAGQPYVLGTKQLPGDFGKIGQEYTIGVNDPINVVVKNVSYTTDRIFVETIGSGKDFWMPKAGKKFLRVDMTLKNGNPKQVEAYTNLTLTAVDANDENVEWTAVYNAKTGKEVSQALKPGQAIDVFVLLPVTAEGEVPKLMIAREGGAAILRFDLRGKATPLPKWAGTGPNALDTIAGIRDCVHPFQYFDVGLRGLAWTRNALDGDPPNEGERYQVAYLTVRGVMNGIGLSYGTFDIGVKTEEGSEIGKEATGGVGGFLLEKSNTTYNGTPAPKETILLRVFFRVKEGVNPKTLTIKDAAGTGRAVTFDVSGQDWFTIRDCVRDIRTGGPISAAPPSNGEAFSRTEIASLL